jgi:hypothetical protein
MSKIRENLIAVAIEREIEATFARWAARDAMRRLTDEEKTNVLVTAADRVLEKLRGKAVDG